MRRYSLLSICFLLSIFRVQATSLPLTTKDVSLMLRAGDSNALVIQELSKRHFVDTLDPEKETALVKAGASSELITALRTGAYSLPPEQAARAQQKIVDVTKKRAEQAEESHRLGPVQKEQLAQKKTALPNTLDPNATADYLKGLLVRLNNGKLVPADDDAIGRKKLIAYYFSAHWCGPCRAFTPKLVEYYNRVSAQHPELEIVFYSFDKTADAMEGYMRETNMPWPAIDFAKRDQKQAIMKAAGNGIPSLVLVESTGKLISSAFDGTKYVGPQKVLNDLDAILEGKAPAQIAQARTN